MHEPLPANAKSLLHNLDRVYLRLSVTSRCNLRCRYCMPAEGVHLKPQAMIASDDELLELVTLFNEVRPTYKVRLTGGEPTLRKGLPTIAAGLRRMLPQAKLCLTTNGIMLPAMADELKAAGLDSINFSLDTLNAGEFKRIARRDRMSDTLLGLESALLTGFREVKINGVLVRSVNHASLPDLVDLAAAYGVEIRFIELMPLGEGRRMFAEEFYSAGEALERLLQVYEYLGPLPGGATSERHRLRRNGREVTVGFIRTMSAPFCDSCDRMRIDAYGRLFTCLRSVMGMNLLPSLRAGKRDEIRAKILWTMSRKAVPEGEWPEVRSMVKIGG